MLVGSRGSRREFLRLLSLGGVAVAVTAGCSIPASLAENADKLPDLPLDGLASLTSAPTPTVSEIASPTVPPGVTATPSEVAQSAEALVVGRTDGDGVYIRSSIKPEKKVKIWPDGTQMLVVGADQTVDRRSWKNVRDPAGNVGWVPSQYLMPTPRAVTTSKAGATPGSATATPAASLGAPPARWNVAELDAFASGNIALAAQQIRALGVAEVKGRAQRPAAAAVLRDPTKYYGSILRLEGYVGQVQQAPADSSVAQLLGLGVVHLLMSCRDGTVVDVFQIGLAGDARVGDLVAAYGLPVGQLRVEDRLAGPTTRLVVVTRLIEKVSR